MADMTLSERITRTIELDAELRSLWPSNNVTSGIHGWSHMDVHEGAMFRGLCYALAASVGLSAAIVMLVIAMGMTP